MARHRAAPARKSSAPTGSRKSTRWGDTPKPRDYRQEVILRSVANVLRNSRLSSLTIQDVADELGMTKGNLYYYFKDKQDILYQCHMRCMEISLRALEDACANGRTPTESLRILLTGHIRGILEDGFGSILQTDLEHFRPEQRKSLHPQARRTGARRPHHHRGRHPPRRVRLSERQADGICHPGRDQLDSEVVSARRALLLRDDCAGDGRLFLAWPATPA